MDEKRKRLTRYLKSGQATPNPGVTVPPAFPKVFLDPPSPSSPHHTPATDPLDLRKFGVRFDGAKDPVAFLEQLEEMRSQFNVPADRVLSAMPQILTGGASLWYRNRQQEMVTWNDFIEAFQNYYFPTDYFETLEEDIYHRKQRIGETVTEFITDLQTMMRRHGSFDQTRQLSLLQRNLLPEFRQMLWGHEVKDIDTFIRKTREIEALRSEVQYQRRTITPKTAPSPTPVQTPPIEPPPRRNPQKISPSDRPGIRSPMICWRCGETGHARISCRNQPVLFCSRCGKSGILSRDCKCEPQEN